MYQRQKKIEKRYCYYCVNDGKEVDFREPEILRHFISSFKKIAPRRRSGLCALHQRKVARAIKRAREMSLMPYCPS